jgi:murein DD-endopeptidase MepM/ murein hydrolase activator NlpD
MGRRAHALAGLLAGTAAALSALVPAAAAYAGGTPAPSVTGGTEYGAAVLKVRPIRPRASVFTVSPHTVTAPALPKVSVRVDQPGSRAVQARVVFVPRGPGTVARIDLGTVATGQRIDVAWPAGSTLAPGRYLVRLHVRGAGNRVLARSAQSSGRTNLVVKAPAPPPPPPAPVPAPAPAPAPAAPAPVAGSGVFPVAGPHTFGDTFGVPRKGYSHQGQDVAAAEGVPVVAPLPGTILYVDNQPSAAGFYVVQRAADGRDFFYAHCQEGSVAVAPGQAVTPGQRLCNVGSTGSATGPHLHFEIWIGGWRVNAASRPVDPLPDLKAWEVPPA